MAQDCNFNSIPDSQELGNGLYVEYYNTTNLTGSPSLRRIEPNIDFDYDDDERPAPSVAFNFSARFRGILKAESGGVYTFRLRVDDGARLRINGQTLIDRWNNSGTFTASLPLIAGSRNTIELDYRDTGGDASCDLAWRRPGTSTWQIIPTQYFSPASDANENDVLDVCDRADLSVTLIPPPNPVPVGAEFAYVFQVRNGGPDPAAPVTLRQTLPANVTLTTATAEPSGVCTLVGDTLVCDFGTLAADEIATATVLVTPTATGPAATSARVMALQTDPSTGNNTASFTSTVVAPQLVVDSVQVSGGNGNGVIDVNECNELTVVLRNTGTYVAQNVSATLSSATPGVTITRPESSYPDISTDDSQANLLAFNVSTAPDFVCGTPIQAVLDVVTDTGSFSLPVTLETGAREAHQFNVAGPVTILNSQGYGGNPSGWRPVTVNVPVSGLSGSIHEVTASLHIEHDRRRDVRVELISPDGTTIILFSGVGGTGDDFGTGCSNANRTKFSDSAAIGIGSGSGNFTGTYRPQEPFSTFKGMDASVANGTWVVRITDMHSMNSGGTLECLSLGITTAVCADSGAQCAMVDLAVTGTDSPDPVLRTKPLTYEFVVANNGPSDATGVVFTAPIPDSVNVDSYLPGVGTANLNGDTLEWQIGSLAAGTTAGLTLTVAPDSEGTLSLTATVQASEYELNPADNSVTVETTVDPYVGADLAVSVTDSADPARLFSTVDYTITLDNQGPDTATSTALTIQLSGNLQFTTATADVAAVITETAPGEVLVELGDVADGTSVTVTLSAQATALGTASVGVSAGSDLDDPDTTNNTEVEETLIAADNLVLAAAVITSGDGMVSPDECNDLQIVLSNTGLFRSENIQATLSSATTGVLVTQPVSSYPDIEASSADVNSTAFQVSTWPDFVCGTAIELTLNVSSDTGSFTIPVTLETGVRSSLRVDTETTYAIPDAEGNGVPQWRSVDIPFEVSGVTGNVTQVTASIHLLHQEARDVIIELIAPDGTTALLARHEGATGADYGTGCADELRATFDDSASADVTGGNAPFVGTFRSVGEAKGGNPLTVFNGMAGVDGTWILRVTDRFGNGIAGEVQCASLGIEWADCPAGLGACPAADLTVTGSAERDPAPVGHELVTTFVASNTGGMDATSVTVQLDIPATATLVSAVADDGTTATTADGLTWEIDTLAVGASTTLTVTLIPNEVGQLVLVATGSPVEFELNPADNTAVVDVAIEDGTDLRIEKTGPAAVRNQDSFSYHVTVTNDSSVTATNVLVTDVFPAGVAFQSAIPSQGVASYDNGTLEALLGQLDPGSTAAVHIEVFADQVQVGSIFNTAVVEADQPDYDLSNNSSTVETLITPLADVEIVKSASSDEVINGELITYSLLVTNHGPDTVPNVHVEDTIPVGTEFVSTTSTQGAADYVEPNVVADLGELADGNSATITVVVRATQAGPVSNTGVITGADYDGNLANNSSTTETTVLPGADVAVSVVNTPDPVVAGGETTFTLVAVNNGPDTATTGILTFELPAELTLTTATSELTTCTEVAPGLIVCELGDLNAGSSVTVEVLAVVTAVGTFDTTASITSDTADPVLSNNVVIEPVTAAVADFSAVSVSFADADGDGRIEAGECATLTLTVQNESVLEATSVVGVLSSGTPGVTVTQSASAYSDLASGTSGANLTGFEICVDPEFVCGTPISLELVLTSDQGGATLNFAPIATGVPYVWTHESGPISVEIPDAESNDPSGHRSVQIPIEISETFGNVTGVTVSLQITHPQSQDLRLELTAPGDNPTTVVLSNRNGGGNSSDYGTVESPATFDDNATASITSAPHGSGFAAGEWQPEEALAAFIGRTGSDVNGTWILTVTDTSVGDNSPTPTVNMVGLAITTAWCGDVADLAIEKTADASQVTLGANVVYTITVTNNGPDAAHNVIVTDELTSATFVDGTASVGVVSHLDGVVTAELGTLAANTSATVTVEVTTTEAGVIPNTAAVTGDAIDLNTSNNTDSVNVTVDESRIDLVVDKTADAAEVTVGQNVTYTITVTNNGPDAASEVVVTDVIASSATFVSVSSSQGSASEDSGTVTAELGSLAANSSATVTLVVRADEVGTLSNTATVAAAEEDLVPGNNTSSVDVAVKPLEADLTITKTADLTTVTLGGQVTYTLLVTNNGPDDATSVTVTDVLDSAATHIDSSASQGTATYEAGTVTAELGTIASGSSATVTIVVAAGAEGALTNTASVTANEQDMNPADNSDTVAVSVIVPLPVVDLAVTKEASDVAVLNGDGFGYVISVYNAGPDDATSVTVFDPIDPSLSIVDVFPSQGDFTVTEGGTISADLGALPAGTTATIEILVVSSEVKQVLNSAFVTGAETDPVSENNTDSVVVDVLPAADLRVTQTATPNPANLFTPVTFTVSVLNAGPDSATTVTLTDSLSDGLIGDVTLTKGTWSISSHVVTAQIGTLAAGEMATMTVTVTPQLQTTLVNNVEVSASEADPLPDNNASGLSVPVGSAYVDGVVDEFDSGSLDGSAGWVPFGYEIQGFAWPTYDQAAGAYKANIAPDPIRMRVAGVRAVGSALMPYSAVGPNRIVRAKYYLYAGGQPRQIDIPAIRLRAAIRFAQTSLLEVFTHTSLDPGATPVSTELAPSSNPLTPSLYRVDFDPIDVPSVVNNAATEGIMRAFEVYTTDVTDQGYVAMTESVLGTYSTDVLPMGATPLKVYAPSGSGAGNMSVTAGPGAALTSATLIFSDEPGMPAVTAPASDGFCSYEESLQGVTLSTVNVVNPDAVAVITREFYPGTETSRARVEEGKQYLVRFHVTSTVPSGDNAMLNFRVRSAKFSYTQRLIVGGGHAASLENNQIAAESLPGIGTLNPDRNQDDLTGGWYNVLMYSPLSKDIRPEFSEDQPLSERMPNFTAQPGPGQAGESMRDLRVGVDIVDTLSRGFQYWRERGHMTVDRIEVREFNAIED